ncbi:Ninjurin-1 [Amphibalanus amphitrite]|uniref:Ninjurin-1 n=1 Tax=Amphibalanus amphitrite TaxID=1232801 RepID=A0A6A4VIY6_AMPAM|nr:Ninjurin-1 [Amphibalanus amphitrite]
MTSTNGDVPPRSADPDTGAALLEGGEAPPAGVQPFEEDLSGGGGDVGGGPGVEDVRGGGGRRRNKWTRVSDVRPMKQTDIDVYSTKKTVTQGFMDVALLSANADQLRTLVTRGDPDSPFRVVCIVFLAFSIVLQVVIAVCLMLKARYNINKQHHFRRAETINNVCMIASILLTVFNVLASAFTGEVPPVPSVPSATTLLENFHNSFNT